MMDTISSNGAAPRALRRRNPCRAAFAGLVIGAAGLTAWPAAQTLAAEMAPTNGNGAPVNQYAPNADVYASAAGDGQIHPWHAQGQIWLMAGEPGQSNVAVQVGNQGVLVVDTGTTAMAGKLLAQIRQLAQRDGGDQKEIRYVVNTDGVPDHIGGNQVIREGGSTVVAGNFRFDNPGLTPGATVMANQNVLSRLVAESTAGDADAAQPLWPTDTQDFDLYNTAFDGEAVQLFHPHMATTDGNLMVVFRRSDVIATGDVVDMVTYPIIDVARGGTIDGELVALNKVIELAVPADKQEGGTLVIPGHGRMCDQSDVVHYKNVITIIRNRVQYYKDQGKSLQQVLALKPSGDYDERWGATSGPWTTQQFIEAIYKTLPAKGPNFSMHTITVVPASGTVSGARVY
jgi:glyoxylase-like metal-dependent hydrolase (beta-lactamase superfamily II)